MNNETDFSVVLKPVTLKAFGESKGFWTDYEQVAAVGITELAVTIELKGRRIDTDLFVLDIDAYFDTDALPSETYGIVYGDGQFEAEVNRHIGEVFRVNSPDANIGYTESGMQGDDYISLEGNDWWRRHLGTLSNHSVLALTRNPHIAHGSFPAHDVSWEGQNTETVS